jgi:hypothetical protein
MDLLDKVQRTEEVSLSRSRRGAAHLHPSRGTILAQHNRAACGGLQICVMPDLDTGYVSDGALHGSSLSRAWRDRSATGTDIRWQDAEKTILDRGVVVGAPF